MIEVLKAINLQLINENQNNPKELKKQELIKQILNTEKCFFKMEISEAYTIFKDLKIDRSKFKQTYLELINESNF